jgi:hypothetical protein
MRGDATDRWQYPSRTTHVATESVVVGEPMLGAP